jgi:TRAP-type mannitol/chloroaromatic compound transport system permease small subunit
MQIFRKLNDNLGKILSHLLLLMVIVGFLVVVLRYFFEMGWVWMQEIVSYSHAFLFLGCLGYAFIHDEHVRVDVFYSKFSEKKKNKINFWGNLLFLFPFCLCLIYISFPYVKDSWSVFEGSTSGGGLEAVFLLKSLLILGPLLLMAAGIHLMFHRSKD